MFDDAKGPRAIRVISEIDPSTHDPGSPYNQLLYLNKARGKGVDKIAIMLDLSIIFIAFL